MRGAKLTLDKAVTLFLEDSVHFAKATLLNYRSILASFTETTGPNVGINRIGRREVRQYFYGGGHTSGIRGTVAPATFNLRRTALVAFFNWALDEGYVAVQPINSKTVPPEMRQSKPRLFLSVEQIVRLMNLMDHPRDRLVVALLANTGMRDAEMRRLTIGDVDLERGFIRSKVSKGNKINEAPITADLDRELRSWLTWYTEQVGDVHARKCDLNFGHRTCGHTEWHRPLCRNWRLLPAKRAGAYSRDGRRDYGALRPNDPYTTARLTINAGLENMGLRVRDADGLIVVGAGTGCHTMRRSAATEVFKRVAQDAREPGAALSVTSRFLNHTSTRTTEIYLDINHTTTLRNDYLKGQEFLTMQEASNVVPLVGEA